MLHTSIFFFVVVFYAYNLLYEFYILKNVFRFCPVKNKKGITNFVLILSEIMNVFNKPSLSKQFLWLLFL